GAIAANQAEGAWNVAGKLPNVTDTVVGIMSQNPSIKWNKDAGIWELDLDDDLAYLSHEAIDFYHRFDEDLKMLSEMGFKAFRTSVSWSRIFPRGDEEEPNQKGLDFYKHLIDSIFEHGMEPVISMSHYETPFTLLAEYGGWTNRKLVNFFERYAQVLIDAFKGKVKYWRTFNAINNVFRIPYVAGGILPVPPNNEVNPLCNSSDQDKYQATHNLFVANALATKYLNEVDPDAHMGAMCSFSSLATYPNNPDPDNVLGAMNFRRRSWFYTDVMCRGHYPGYILKDWEK